MHVFFNYIVSCVEQGFYSNKILKDNFSSYASLFHLFVREGFIAQEQLPKLYYSFVLTLKEKIETEGVNSVSYNDIVHVLWALAATEDEVLQNPIIPKLFERLHEFNRPQKPLTREELLELYQVSVYSQDQIKNQRWPKEFKEVIPKKVRDICEEEYASFDKNLYNEVQIDIVRFMLVI